MFFRMSSILVCCIVMLATYYQAAAAQSLNWWGEQFPIISYICATLLLLLGIAFGSIFRSLSNGDGAINIIDEINAAYRSRSFWISICVSPFVLFGVYSIVSQSPGDPASYLLAFQNGFFCESVFRKLVPDASMSGHSTAEKLPNLST